MEGTCLLPAPQRTPRKAERCAQSSSSGFKGTPARAAQHPLLITLHGHASQTLTCFPVCAAHRATLRRLLSFKLRSRNQQVAGPRPLYRTWTSTGREGEMNSRLMA